MRITRQQLQEMIDEGVADALFRRENRRLVEAQEPGGPLYNVSILNLIEFARAYASIGGAAQAQLNELLTRHEAARLTPGGFDAIEEALRGRNRQLDAALDSWYRRNGDDTM